MYLANTLQQYLIDILHIDKNDIIHFDNANGKTGYRVNVQSVSRKDIAEIEKKTDLFLQHVRLIAYWENPETQIIELEFIKL